MLAFVIDRRKYVHILYLPGPLVSSSTAVYDSIDRGRCIESERCIKQCIYMHNKYS